MTGQCISRRHSSAECQQYSDSTQSSYVPHIEGSTVGTPTLALIITLHSLLISAVASFLSRLFNFTVPHQVVLSPKFGMAQNCASSVLHGWSNLQAASVAGQQERLHAVRWSGPISTHPYVIAQSLQ